MVPMRDGFGAASTSTLVVDAPDPASSSEKSMVLEYLGSEFTSLTVRQMRFSFVSSR